MNSNGKVRFQIDEQQVNTLNELPYEKEQQLLSYLQKWKSRVIKTAIDHHLSSNYPDEQFVQKWCKEEVKRK